MPIYQDDRTFEQIQHRGRPIGAIYHGNRLLWSPGGVVHAPKRRYFGTPGRYAYRVPSWAGYLDIITLGGGGGGANGNSGSAQAGHGGYAGKWSTVRIDVRDLTELNLVVSVGWGGAKPPESAAAGGGDGQGTVVLYSNQTDQVAGTWAEGGKGGYGNVTTNAAATGESSGNRTFHGSTYTGGTGGTNKDNNGGGTGGRGSGGGGGAGGIFGVYWYGGAGGPGAAWITARTRRSVESEGA
ncbi:glycine-rich domain-containing protein [Tomitella fengzijianii]|uniref:Glycine-rich domain-containing protein n=1 Tax=Tomitella fengzijianii TaxID=2597660 RepID=A0A516X4L6_9ACTN|nr:hypothetical protein [Tomitella fengzijianii]QDQ97994.1 hypothetical protein FO059_12540 [Tomitella fengzijianii]